MSVKWPAIVLGVGGILFTAAGTRSIWSSAATTRQRFRQLGLVVVLLLIFGTQLAAGIDLLGDSRRNTPVQLISDALIASLLVGVARAWELVGARDTGIIASLAVLSRHTPSPVPASGLLAVDVAGATEGGAAAGPERRDHESGERPG
jgi:hypothetical protein